MNYIYLYLILSIFHNLTHLGYTEKEMDQNTETVEKFVNNELVRFRKKYKVNSIGSSIGMPGGRLKRIELMFQIQGPLSQETLRAMVVTYADDFFNSICSSPELVSILQLYPIKIQDITIVFFLVDKKGANIDAPEIGVAELYNGEVKYTTYNANPKSKSHFIETLEEARNKLKQE